MIFLVALVFTVVVLAIVLYDDRKSFPFSWAKVGGFALLSFPWILGACYLITEIAGGIVWLVK